MLEQNTTLIAVQGVDTFHKRDAKGATLLSMHLKSLYLPASADVDVIEVVVSLHVFIFFLSLMRLL